MVQEPSTQPSATLPLTDDAPWSRVEVAPPGAWVEAESYEATTSPGEGLDVTQLCLARQVDAVSGRVFHSTAVRLETSQAAERESRWSLPLETGLRRLTLHWLRVLRGGERSDRLRREHLRLVQDQSGGLAPDGHWFLLARLDDLRPGDIVEAAYTCEMHDALRSGGCEVWFTVPPRAVVGRYHLSVRFEAGRMPLRWLASPDAPERRETIMPDGVHRWSWEGAQTLPREEEANMPGHRMDFVWVQVSDLPDWSVLAMRMKETWVAAGDGEGLAEFPAFAKPGLVDGEAVLRLVSRLQEEFRHTRLELPAEGWVPPKPSEVARRRYGNSKDLVWLAATALHAWGVSARPVLVSATWRETVVELLPMAGLFDHVVLEVEAEGWTRWFDLTERGQGGGFRERAVPWFGHGLPLDGADKGLRAQPGERTRGVHAVRETVLLDTARGGASLVEERVRAEGWLADRLRHALRTQGLESFARTREQEAQSRHRRVRRLGGLRWHDDPAVNVFELVEVFELGDAMRPEERGLRAVHDVAPGVVASWLALPEDKLRRGPWVLPFPCELRHTVTIKAPGLTAGAGRRRRWAEPEFEASQEDTRLSGIWIRTYRFVTLAPELSARRVPAYRKVLADYLREAVWRIYLPWGRGRVRRGKGFGELDGVAETSAPEREDATALPAAPVPTVSSASPLPETPAVEGGAAAEFKRESSGRRRRRSRDRRLSAGPRSKSPAWLWKAVLGVVVTVMLVLIYGCLGGA